MTNLGETGVGLRFRKSFTIVRGVRLNVGPKSVSVSAGVRGFTLTKGTRGQRATVSLPSTGLSYTQPLSSNQYWAIVRWAALILGLTVIAIFVVATTAPR